MQSTNQHTAAEEVVEGLEPDAADIFYSNLGEELAKGQLTYLRDLLHKFVTLDAALIAAILLFLDRRQLPLCLNVAVLVILFLSLACSIVGIIPFRRTICWIDPDQVRQSLASAYKWKWWLLVAAASWLGVGILVAIVGIATN